MVKLLTWCGYEVKSPNKLQNCVMNIIDGILIIGYFVLSCINIAQSMPSVLLIFIPSRV